MAEPVYDEATEELYAGLPEVQRVNDIPYNYSLKRYLSGIGYTLGEVYTLIDRFSYTPPDDGVATDTSELVDPYLANVEWLPWLAQLVGVKVKVTANEADWRAAIASAVSGTKAGTKQAIVEAAQTVLTGSKVVYIYDHSNATDGIGNGDQWDVLITTLEEETTSDPVAAVLLAGAKPAGINLTHMYYGATWDTIESELPTWNDWEGKTWEDIETLIP